MVNVPYFEQQFNLPANKTCSVFVGAETDVFSQISKGNLSKRVDGRFTVLFYGQFIPLHGIETIIRAARLMKDDPVQWIIIGQGQEEKKIRAMLDEQPLPLVTWINWVKYEDLIKWIGKADLMQVHSVATQSPAQLHPQ